MKARILLCAAALSIAMLAGAQKPLVAVVLKASGNTAAISTSGGPARPLKTLQRVRLGDTLVVSGVSEVRIAWTNSGAVYDLSGCKVLAKESGPSLVSGKRPVLIRTISREYAQAMAPRPDLSQMAGVVARGAAEIAELRPQGAVRDPHVILSWAKVDDAQELHLTVYHRGDPIYESDLDPGAVSAQIPDGKLADGQTYAWILSATMADGSMLTGTSNIRILTAAERRLVAKLESEQQDTLLKQVLSAVQDAWKLQGH